MTSILIGTMAFGDTVDEATAREIIGTAVEAGAVEIDTAVSYAGGASEQTVGRILRDHGDEIAVSSKVGMQQPSAGGPLSAAEIVRCARLSVERVGRPLDTLYLHQPDRSTPLDDTADGIAAVLDEGTAGRIGVSNHASWQAAELAAACRERGVPTPVRAQQIYNPLARGIEVEFLPYAAERGIETVVYNPLAGGLLSGRYDSSTAPGEGRFGTSALAGMYRDRYWRPEFLAVVDDLQVLAREAGVTLAELALRWTISPSGVDGVLVGASRPEQMRANVAAIAAGPLSDEVRDAVNRTTAPVRDLAPGHAR